MRKFAFLALILISYLSYSQSQNDIKAKLKLIEKIDLPEFQLDSTGYNDLPSIIYECAEDETGILWHVTDLNNDGLKDLIYSGPCKPYYQTAVFLNIGTEFQKAKEYPGKLLLIEITQQESIIGILKSSCCCDYYNDFIEFKVGFDNSLKNDQVKYHMDTKISLNEEYKVERISGILRTMPIVNDSVYKDPCLTEVNIGNQVLKIENKEVIVIDSKKDWDLVVYRKDNEHSLIGWVKNKKQQNGNND